MPDHRTRPPRGAAKQPAARRTTARKPASAGRKAPARGPALSTLQAGRRPAPARPGAALKGAKRPAAKRSPAGQPARRPKKGAAGATALSALLVTILGACLLFAAYEFQNYRAFRTMRAAVDSDAFYPGVVVDGTDLGGMTLTQALAAFVDRERDRASATGATFAYGDRRWTLTPEDLGYRTDYVDVLKSAYRLGREGSLRQRYAEVLRLADEGTPLSITRGYDPSALRAAVDDIAGQLARDARDASIGSFNFSSRTFQFTSASAGMVVDADELYARAERAISRGSRETIEVAPTRIEPKVTSAQLTAKYGLITSAVTNASSSSKNRLTNIRTALSAIDGTRLDPGEVFSFNGTVGKRTAERGYRPAGAYVDGLVTEEVGGGICQVSTTLFNAAVKADLAIVERSAHSRPVAYVDKGKDATVSWPGPDLRFRNDTDEPVYIAAYLTEGSRVHIEAYGRLLDKGLTIKVEAKTLKTLQPGGDKVSVNRSLPPGSRVVIEKARVGYSAVAYKVYYRDGKEIKREELCRSTYRASGAIIEVGPS